MYLEPQNIYFVYKIGGVLRMESDLSGALVTKQSYIHTSGVPLMPSCHIPSQFELLNTDNATPGRRARSPLGRAP